MEKFIIYYRESKSKQLKLSLGYQHQAVEKFISNRKAESISPPFTERKDGNKHNWPELRKAIAKSQATKSMLLIARLDKMCRSESFLSVLHKSKAYFYCVDMPLANYQTIDDLVQIAKQDRSNVNRRIREGLSTAKSFEVKLGNPYGAAALRKAGKGNVDAVATLKKNADKFALDLKDTLIDMKDAGMNFSEIARSLNESGIHTSSRRGKWHSNTVKSVLDRISTLK